MYYSTVVAGGDEPRPYAAKHIKNMGTGERITAAGVRVGMNPAPTLKKILS